MQTIIYSIALMHELACYCSDVLEELSHATQMLFALLSALLFAMNTQYVSSHPPSEDSFHCYEFIL